MLLLTKFSMQSGKLETWRYVLPFFFFNKIQRKEIKSNQLSLKNNPYGNTNALLFGKKSNKPNQGKQRAKKWIKPGADY